ncbi:MAG: XRE family transcriptional regulator [Pseudonocardiales bacterium]|nr:MAG: XRE family transcriptional regulator [Pseudonocardiales bacterium]
MTPDEMRQLAAQIREKRITKGLSATEVAKRAGVNPGTVTRLELGQIREPRPSNLLAIAAALDIAPHDIFTMSHWLPDKQLPSFTPYLRQKYAFLPEHAFEEIEQIFDELTARYGTSGPMAGEDEY